jgi:hypothetical protein
MALINRPSCDKNISSEAVSCPECGHPLRKQKRPLFSKPAGCFVQLIGAGLIIWGLAELTKSPLSIIGAIFPFAAGGAVLLLGRKTR